MSRTVPASIALAATFLAACSGGEKKAPAPPVVSPAVPPPAVSRESPRLDPLSEVRVALTWDEPTQTVHRKIGDRELPKDDELRRAITEAHDGWKKQGKADAPVTIDADARVPWTDVITVVNIVKRCGIEKIEFAMGAPPKRAAPK